MEALQEEAYKGIVRLDADTMKKISVRPGDVVEIEAGRITVGIADRAYPTDVGQNIIRIDGILRRNAKTGVGEYVMVRKADVKEAKSVTIAPAQKGIMIRADPSMFKRNLLGRAVLRGDIVVPGGVRSRRRTMMDSPFFEDIFQDFFEGFGMGFSGATSTGLKFAVISTNPSKQPVIITESTELTLDPKGVDVTEEKEMIKAPDLTYEDVGGLEEEITKIREMVELPLKHPEIFTRLGIEPPKGVLLHGPTGTGKTLLAKAVANESEANFKVVNGPEIMNKFYGQSLTGDEKVLINENRLFKRIPIKEISLEGKQVQAVCFDEGGKVILKEIKELIKHKPRSKIFEVTTRSGRKIKVTEDHSLFTIGEKGITDVKTSELKENKSFIAVPNKIPLNPNPVTEIDLTECLKNEDYGICVRNVQNDLKSAKKKLGIKRMAFILGVREKYAYDIISKNVGVRFSKFSKLMEEAGIKYNKDFLQIHTKSGTFPHLINFSEDFWTFLGLWVAEGSYMKNGVRLSIHRKEEKIFSELCKKLFGHITVYRKPNSQGSDIIISSLILKKVMEDVLGFNSGATKKVIPQIVYNLNRECLAAFLRGYFSGDGSINTKTPAPMIEVSTESPNLADDIMFLLLQFGIVAKVYLRKNRSQKRICFADYDNLEKFKEIGFLDSNKNQIIYSYTSTQKFSRRDQLPITGVVKQIIESIPRLRNCWKNSKSIGKNVLQQVPDPLLQSLIGGDIYWDKIISIKEMNLGETDYVYDISVPGAENFISGFGGIYAHNSESNLRKIFEDAEKEAPSILFFDEIDAIAPKREESYGEVERRVVSQFLTLLDGLKSRGKLIVIGATNRPNSLDPALRRPGRFDREIAIGVPNKHGRLNILKIHTRNMPLAKDVNLERLSEVTHGFVGADIAAMCREAAMNVLRRMLPELKIGEKEEPSKEVLEKLQVSSEDFDAALKLVRPSAMREVLVETPNVHWQDIGGAKDIQQELKEAVEWPLKNPEVFKKMGIRAPRGLLLHGPPGTGKTLLAKAVANESEANFILVRGPELLNKFVGESEKGVRKVFEKARQVSPAIIFFDEIDSMAPRRGYGSDSQVTERVVNTMLSEMDGLEELGEVVVLAATNRIDILDPALLRPGRFDRLLLTKPPTKSEREAIFAIHSKKMPLAKDVILKKMAEKTEGYVGADIEAVCREAGMLTLRENLKSKEIKNKHFEQALRKVRPSVTPQMMEKYKKVEEDYIQKTKAGISTETQESRSMGYVG
ncbi:MAG: AAA family ATPase [Nanoarchaeota archaeon]|nr:AAA family ATPase [Nanoarchaeota archaeon]